MGLADKKRDYKEHKEFTWIMDIFIILIVVMLAIYINKKLSNCIMSIIFQYMFFKKENKNVSYAAV